MWSLKIPNKVKHFGWRACTESLPTLANLHRRKVVQSPLCSNCNRAQETVQHALWDCDQVLGYWGYGFKNLRNSEQGTGVFADLVFLARQQDVNMELFMVTAWMIWYRIRSTSTSNTNRLRRSLKRQRHC